MHFCSEKNKQCEYTMEIWSAKKRWLKTQPFQRKIVWSCVKMQKSTDVCPVTPPCGFDFVMRGHRSADLRNCAVRVSAGWKYDKSEVEGRWASLVSKLRLHTADSTWSTLPQTAVSPTPSVYLPLSFLSFNLCISPFAFSPFYALSPSIFIFIQMHTHIPDSQPPELLVAGLAR